MHKCFFSGCVDCNAGTIIDCNFDLDDSYFLTFSHQHELQAHEAMSLSESTLANVQGRLKKQSSFGRKDVEASERHHALSLKQLTSLLQCATRFVQGDWFFTFDLKSGYHHVDINEDCWKYLGFL